MSARANLCGYESVHCKVSVPCCWLLQPAEYINLLKDFFILLVLVCLWNPFTGFVFSTTCFVLHCNCRFWFFFIKFNVYNNFSFHFRDPRYLCGITSIIIVIRFVWSSFYKLNIVDLITVSFSITYILSLVFLPVSSSSNIKSNNRHSQPVWHLRPTCSSKKYHLGCGMVPTDGLKDLVTHIMCPIAKHPSPPKQMCLESIKKGDREHKCCIVFHDDSFWFWCHVGNYNREISNSICV